MIESGHVRDYRGMTRAQLAMHLHEALMGELRVLEGVLLSRGRCDA